VGFETGSGQRMLRSQPLTVLMSRSWLFPRRVALIQTPLLLHQPNSSSRDPAGRANQDHARNTKIHGIRHVRGKGQAPDRADPASSRQRVPRSDASTCLLIRLTHFIERFYRHHVADSMESAVPPIHKSARGGSVITSRA
jgi:hypothetical protein